MAEKKKAKKKSPPVHKKNGRSQNGKSNGRWKGGASKSFRRRVTKAKPGQVVHHKDKNKKNNKPSNFKKVSPGDHNRAHKEKGGNHSKKKKKK